MSSSLPERPHRQRPRRSWGASAHQALASHGIHRPRLLRGERLEHPLVAPAIFTERLVLRPHRTADADAWYAIESDPDVRRYLAWPARGRSESLHHLRDRTRHTRLLQPGDFLALAVEYDHHLIGDVSLHLRSAHPGEISAEIGWVFATTYAGNGFATEASGALLDFAFDTLDAREISAVMSTGNLRSQRLAVRLGLVEVEREPSTVRFSVTAEGRRALATLRHPLPSLRIRPVVTREPGTLQQREECVRLEEHRLRSNNSQQAHSSVIPDAVVAEVG